MNHSLTMIAVGAMLGFLSGLFGVGGSSVATPLLRLLHVPALFALATPLPITLPTAIVGGATYWRRGFVCGRAVLWTAAGGVPAVVVGSFCTTVLPGRLLMLLTGILVVAVGIRLLGGAPGNGVDPTPVKSSPWLFLGLGTGVGFLSGMLANGGGFLLVPLYLWLFKMEAREAAATSLVAVALLALPGTVVHWSLGHIDPALAGLLALGVIPFTYLGARVGLRLEARQSRLLFGNFLLLFGLFFVLRTAYRVEQFGWWGGSQ